MEYLSENLNDDNYMVLLEKIGKDKWELIEIAHHSGTSPRIRNESQELLLLSSDYRKAKIYASRSVKVTYNEDKITEKRSDFAFDCDSLREVEIQKKEHYTPCNSALTSGYRYTMPTLGGQRSFEKRTYRLSELRNALLSAEVVASIEKFKAGAWTISAAQANAQPSIQTFQLWLVKPTRGGKDAAYLFRVDTLYAKGDALRIGSDQLHLVTSSFGIFGSRQGKQPWEPVYRFIILDRNKYENRSINSNAPALACDQIHLVRKDGSADREKVCTDQAAPKAFLYFARSDGPLIKVDLAKGAKKPIGHGEWQPAELVLDTYQFDEIRVVEDESKANLQ